MCIWPFYSWFHLCLLRIKSILFPSPHFIILGTVLAMTFHVFQRSTTIFASEYDSAIEWETRQLVSFPAAAPLPAALHEHAPTAKVLPTRCHSSVCSKLLEILWCLTLNRRHRVPLWVRLSPSDVTKNSYFRYTLVRCPLILVISEKLWKVPKRRQSVLFVRCHPYYSVSNTARSCGENFNWVTAASI